MLDDSLREDAIFSRGFFPSVRDLLLTSDEEDLDFPSRVRLRELGGLEDSCLSEFDSPPRVSLDVFEDPASPVF